ncbi:MAG: aspartate aminotransferase family protein, partial [Chloroflexi bacterium]|nr:aspartate aminotransferase family protein [Chloroflexota bacterium]
DGHARVDLINNMTTLILGHSHPAVVKAVSEQAARGLSFPAPSELVVRWAEILVERIPSLDKVRFVNSGTEGTLNAIRAARAFTGKDKIGKFEGGYHGAHDDVAVSVDPPLARAGDGRSPNSVVDYLGVPAKSAEHTIVMPYNDLDASLAIIEKHKHELAAVIVEPVIGRLGMLPADLAFLKGLRDVTRRHGIILIFDEVIALRVARGGAQERFGVTPDMTAMGKIIGGGMPVGGFGGRDDIMELFSPKNGPKVKHAGTFNGNPMTAAAGIATLEALTPAVYRWLDDLGDRVRSKLSDLIRDREAPMGVTGIASLFALQFTTVPIRDYRSVQTNDRTLQKLMFYGLLNEGFALSPACAGNVSAAINEKDVDAFVAAVGRVLDRAGLK